ncbi:MAG: GNAT family N-acetyltransferase [Lachnospiraceae bacterium]|nr:GNAT family N-acetyltransferase [Lachnospiraceae bacterium]
MMEFFNLNETYIEGVESLITEEGMEIFRTGESVAIALAEDEKPVGVVIADPGVTGDASIVSLYVKPEERRKGYGTDLMDMAFNMLYAYDNIYTLELSFAENQLEEPGLKEFLEFLEFELEKDESRGAYSFTLADAARSDKLKGEISGDVIPLKDVSKMAKNELVMAHPAIVTTESVILDENTSCVIKGKEKEKEVESMLILGKEKDDLVVLWAQAREGSLDLINMMRYVVVEALKTYGKEQIVRAPYINEHSKKILEKLLGDNLNVSENVWVASLPLEWSLDPDAEEEF